jgi:protein-S-isoprenylcysteine O-methyltransferase Ste14
MWQIISFVLCSLVLIYISRASLRSSHSHGFYRFFAWEGILALSVLNVPFWFRDPFAWHQVIAWILLISSVIPLMFGVHSLQTRGRPVGQRAGDPTLLAFEKTTTLVTSGIYKYIRHPLYSSLLLLTWGIFFKSPSWAGFALASASTAFLIATAKADEAECTRFFGSQYQEYRKHTTMFIPYLF